MMFLSMGIAAVSTLASAYVRSYTVFLILRSQKYFLFLILRSQKNFLFLILRSRNYFLILRPQKYFPHMSSSPWILGFSVVLELWGLLSPCASSLLRSQDPGE